MERYMEKAEDSIFTKIIKGEISSHKVYEDDAVLAFLDIMPDEEGHTLVVPKKQIDKIYDLDDETYAHLWLVAKKIAKHYEDLLSQRVIFHVVGVDVPHAHIHVVPYVTEHHRSSEERAEGKQKQRADDAELAKVAEKLAL